MKKVAFVIILIFFYANTFSQNSNLYKGINKSNKLFFNENIKQCKNINSEVYYRYLKIIKKDKKIVKKISKFLINETDFYKENDTSYFYIETGIGYYPILSYFFGVFWFNNTFIVFEKKNFQFSINIFYLKQDLLRYDISLFKIVSYVESIDFQKYSIDLCNDKSGPEAPSVLVCEITLDSKKEKKIYKSYGLK